MEQTELTEDVRLVLQQLQTARQRQKELTLRVNDLQSEQKVMTERLSLYSMVSAKLKRELINERLAHIDSKKEIEELRAKLQLDSDGEGGGPRSPQENDDNLWSSPNKGSSTGGASNLLSFGSLYSSRIGLSGSGGNMDDEPPSPTSSGMQPLRNSLMGQFLPSTLLDSPQNTPSRPKSMLRDSAGSMHSLEGDMDRFSLDEAATQRDCQQCNTNPVFKCKPCGHRLCNACEALVRAGADRICPRCNAGISSLIRMDGPKQELSVEIEHENQRDLRGDREDAGSSEATSPQSGTSKFISPVTLSLLTELFETIPVDELENTLKQNQGQVSLAVEHILRKHPLFNPAFASEGSIGSASSTGGGGGSKYQSTHRSSLTREVSSSSNVGGPQPGTSSNWKTEMCMYYLQGKCNKTRRTCSFAHGESDLVRSSNPSKHSGGSGGGANHKYRMCPLYLEGACPKSRRDCPFAHGESDLRDGLAVLSSASTILPGAAPRLQSYKTELCYYYLKGCCNYSKAECRFAHGEGDLRTVESNTMELSAQMNAMAAGMGGAPGGPLEKHLQQQQQYQQQFHQQQQPQPPPQVPRYQSQQQQQPQQPPQPSHLGVQSMHQLPPPHHQLAPQHAYMQHQMHMQQQQQSQPHLFQAPPPAHPFRYMKSMDDNKRNRPPPPPPRRENSWSSGFESPGRPPNEY